MKLKIADLAKRLLVNPATPELHEELYNKFVGGWGNGKIRVESTRWYFDSDSSTYNTADVVVGIQIADLDDGVVGTIPDADDAKIRQKLEAKIGDIGKKKLKTYVQFVSNDNF